MSCFYANIIYKSNSLSKTIKNGYVSITEKLKKAIERYTEYANHSRIKKIRLAKPRSI